MTDELARRMEKYAHAKRTVAECEAWFKENWEALGNHDEYGMWYGARQQFTEAYKPEVLRQALYNVAAEHGMPIADILFDELDRYGHKRVAMNPAWKDYIITEIKQLDPEDEGLTIHWGSVNCYPVKNRPSDEKYRVYDPGDEFMPEGYEDPGMPPVEQAEEAPEEDNLL